MVEPLFLAAITVPSPRSTRPLTALGAAWSSLLQVQAAAGGAAARARISASEEVRRSAVRFIGFGSGEGTARDLHPVGMPAIGAPWRQRVHAFPAAGAASAPRRVPAPALLPGQRLAQQRRGIKRAPPDHAAPPPADEGRALDDAGHEQRAQRLQ